MAWKTMSKELIPIEPSLPEEILRESIWWSRFCDTIGADFSKLRAASLHKVGMRHIRDIMIQCRFLTFDEAITRFRLLPTERRAWAALIRSLHEKWGNLLTIPFPIFQKSEWIGCFPDVLATVPHQVFQVSNTMDIYGNLPPQLWLIPIDTRLYDITPVSNCLSFQNNGNIELNTEGTQIQLHGSFRRVRVIKVCRGPKKIESCLYYGRVDQLTWDPDRFQWPGQVALVPILNFTANLGRTLLAAHHRVFNPVERKWQGVLPRGFRLKWRTVWTETQTPKEAGLLWLTWHRDVAVNKWRETINCAIDPRCPVCPRRAEESVLHRFWECQSAQRAWQWGIHIMNSLLISRDAQGPWSSFNWKQGNFSDRIPQKFDQLCSIWMALRTVILWTLWLERNDVAFNDEKWPANKVLHRIWLGLIDYGRVEWKKSQQKLGKSDVATRRIERIFAAKWCRHNIIASPGETIQDGRSSFSPNWILSSPRAGFVFVFS